MPSYRVTDNPYYKQWRGNNLIGDRLSAALGSFSAPETGAYGKRSGFFGSLFGSDVNRMNEADAMRQRDIEGGRVPFEKEESAEKENLGITEGAANARQASGQAATVALQKSRSEDEDRRQLANQHFEESQAGWKNVNENDLALQKWIRDSELARQSNNVRRQGIESTNQYRQGVLKQPRQLGNSAFFPNSGALIKTRMGPNDPEESMGEIQAGPDILNYINHGDPNEDQDITQGLDKPLDPSEIDRLLGGRAQPSLNY